MSEIKAVKLVISLINLVGVTAGIIIGSIGAIMFLNAVFTLYLFGIDTAKYNNFEYRCDAFDVDRIGAKLITGIDTHGLSISGITTNIQELTKEQVETLREQYNECKEQASADAKEEFVMDQKRNMATGMAFMIVGFPLMYFYQRKRKDIIK
jgi:hypothetical protein